MRVTLYNLDYNLNESNKNELFYTTFVFFLSQFKKKCQTQNKVTLWLHMSQWLGCTLHRV